MPYSRAATADQVCKLHYSSRTIDRDCRLPKTIIKFYDRNDSLKGAETQTFKTGLKPSHCFSLSLLNVINGGGWKRYGKQVEMSKVIKHFPVPHVICFLFSDIPPSWTENEKRPGTIFHRIYSPVQFDSCPVSLFAPSRDIARFSFLQRSVFISRRRNILQPSQNFALEYALGIKVFLTKEKKIFREFVVFDLLKNLRNNNSFLDFSIFFVSLYETTLI